MLDVLKTLILLNVCIFSSAFSAPYKSQLKSPFTQWFCVDIAKNIDKSKPYAFSVGELPLVAWFNETRPITTLNICKHMGSKLDQGRIQDGCLMCPYHNIRHNSNDAFGTAIIHEDKLWWSYEPLSNQPPTTPYYKNKEYSTLMFTMDMDANIQDCIFNTLDINHFAHIHGNIFGKNMPLMNYKYKKYNDNKLSIQYKYDTNRNMELIKKGLENFQNFQVFQYPHTSTAIISLNKNEKLIININMLPLAPNKTRWIITLKHNFWKSFFAKTKIDLTMKFILHQDKEQMARQASDTMLKKSVVYKRILGNEEHFRELTRMFRDYEYPDMISTMRLYNYHNNKKE